MTAPHGDEIVEGYLSRLNVALLETHPGSDNEIEADMRAHIAEARAALTSETDADVLNLLDRLGQPEALAAESGGAASHISSAAAPGTESTGMTLPALGAVAVMLVGAVVILPLNPLIFFGPLGALPAIVVLLLGLQLARYSRCWTGPEIGVAGIVTAVVGGALLVPTVFAGGHVWLLAFFAPSLALLSGGLLLQLTLVRGRRRESRQS
jgi:uncharacterized membrane protein